MKVKVSSKNQKGITLMILVVTVVVMAILIGTISFDSSSAFKMQSYYNMCSDIESLDEKIAIYYVKNKELPIISEDYKNISDIIDDYSENNVNYNPNNSGNLYKVDLSKLDNLSLNHTNYYIDEESHTIYATKGVQLDDGTYYTYPLKYTEVILSNYR